TVTNWGSNPVHSITIWDAPPAGSRFLEAADAATGSPDGFICAAPNPSGVIVCSGGGLSGQTVKATNVAGDLPTSRQIIVRVFAPDLPADYPNQAHVDPQNTIPEGNEFNNDPTLKTSVINCHDLACNPYIELAVAVEQDTPPIISGVPLSVE